jgi:RimJ/RimL family protein N-acetyltransferase
MTRGRVPLLRNRAMRATRLATPLATERLVLREFRADDFEAMCRYVCDPRVTRYLFFAPRDIDEARRHLLHVLNWQQERPRNVWELAVEERRGGRHIGACNLTLTAPGEADIGYMLHHDRWGNGMATEVACALRDAAFRDLGAERVISTVDVRNAASLRVLEKTGLRWEATFRRHRRLRGQWRDCHLFVMPRVVWEAL